VTQPVATTIMGRSSVRRFQKRPVEKELVERLVRLGQQAPFTGQMYSFLATADEGKRERLRQIFGKLVERAPLFMLVCVDFNKLDKFVAYRDRKMRVDDLNLLFLGIQDASYAAQNLVLAAEEAGLGSCFLGAAPFVARELVDLFGLPERVYPLVGLVLGYPEESPDARPRIPLDQCLFWDEYRELPGEKIEEAMNVMDASLIREGYYAKYDAKIPVEKSRQDQVPLADYGWSEHVSRKYGERARTDRELVRMLREQGIILDGG